MLKWLLSMIGRGPKVIDLPEAKTHDPQTLYLGRINTESKLSWEYFRLPELLAAMTRVGNTVTELRVRKDLRESNLANEFINPLLLRYEVAAVEWVDQV